MLMGVEKTLADTVVELTLEGQGKAEAVETLRKTVDGQKAQ